MVKHQLEDHRVVWVKGTDTLKQRVDRVVLHGSEGIHITQDDNNNIDVYFMVLNYNKSFSVFKTVFIKNTERYLYFLYLSLPWLALGTKVIDTSFFLG